MKVGDFVFIKFRKSNAGHLYSKAIINDIDTTAPYQITNYWNHPLFGPIYRLSNLRYNHNFKTFPLFYWFYQEDLTELNFIDD